MKNSSRLSQPVTTACRDVEADFGARVRALRKSLDRSQEAVVSRMRQAGYDWHQTTLSKVESGQRGVSLNEAYCLALIVGAHLRDFLDQGPGELQREADRAAASFEEASGALSTITGRYQLAERRYLDVIDKLEALTAEAE